MRLKKWCGVCVCLLLIASSFSACKSDGGDPSTTAPAQSEATNANGAPAATSKTLRLSYSKSDSLNPYFAQSLNNQTLFPLIYNSLFTLDQSYTAQNSLASSFSYNGTALTVQLNSGVKFSDGSTLSATDVVYSFNKAKASPAYKASLSTIRTASTSGNTITFTLTGVDLYAQNLLTFPVVKNGSAEKTGDFPLGSGTYKVKTGTGDPKLVYSQGKKPKLASIDLVNAASQDSIANSLKVGNVSLIFKDLSEGSFSRYSSKTVETSLNHLVYLGINSTGAVLSQPGVRQALNSAVNRTSIVNTAYQGHARAALSPFNPDWAPAKNAKTGSEAPDSTAVKKAMEAAGYTLDAATRLWKKGGASLTLRLLVNSENAFRASAATMLAEQLKEQGFSVTITSVKFSEYNATVKASNFDLYIGELRLPDNMSLSALLEDGAASAGVGAAVKASKDAYKAFREGTAQMDAFLTAFQTDIPFIPLCYRNGLTAYSSEMKGAVSPLPGNVFAGIEDWSF